MEGIGDNVFISLKQLTSDFPVTITLQKLHNLLP
jgi:hypothetical protein